MHELESSLSGPVAALALKQMHFPCGFKGDGLYGSI